MWPWTVLNLPPCLDHRLHHYIRLLCLPPIGKDMITLNSKADSVVLTILTSQAKRWPVVGNKQKESTVGVQRGVSFCCSCFRPTRCSHHGQDNVG